MDSTTAEKKELRKRLLQRREAMGPAAREAASAVITARLDALLHRLSARRICSFIGFGAEVATYQWIERSLAAGLLVAVPRLDRRTRSLLFSELKDPHTELETNSFGIQEPAAPFLRPAPGASFDAIVVPGCAFDHAGHRLGYGLGYYDRTLHHIRGQVPLIGLAFDLQVVDALPHARHDVPMHLVITERGLYPGDGQRPSTLQAVNFEEVLCGT